MLLSLSAVAMAAFGSVLYYHRQSTQLLLEERQKSARLEIESARKLLGCGSDEILSQERLIFEIQVGDVLTTQTSNWLISSSIEFWDEDEPIYLHILDEGKGPFLLVTKENNEWQHFFLLKVKTPFGFNINLNSVNFSETFFRLARRTRARTKIIGPMTINLSDITTLTIFRSGLKKHLIGIERPDGILLLSDVDSSSEEIFFMPAT